MTAIMFKTTAAYPAPVNVNKPIQCQYFTMLFVHFVIESHLWEPQLLSRVKTIDFLGSETIKRRSI